MTDLNEALFDTSCVLRPTGCATISSLNDLSQLTPTQIEVLRRNPFVYDSLLIGQGGERSVSKITPSIVHNTVDNPIFPNTGKRLTASIDLAVLGGNTQFYKPRGEAIFFFRHLPRTSVGFRARPSSSRRLAIARVVRSARRHLRRDPACLRAIVPRRRIQRPRLRHPVDRAERAGIVRGARRQQEPAVQRRIPDLDHEPGAHRRVLRRRTGSRLRRAVLVEGAVARSASADTAAITDPFATSSLVDPSRRRGWKRSKSGRRTRSRRRRVVELRFFMPVLNVPFRLIYAWNPSRGGVLDNNLQPAKDTVFRFAVGTTF